MTLSLYFVMYGMGGMKGWNRDSHPRTGLSARPFMLQPLRNFICSYPCAIIYAPTLCNLLCFNPCKICCASTPVQSPMPPPLSNLMCPHLYLKRTCSCCPQGFPRWRSAHALLATKNRDLQEVGRMEPSGKEGQGCAMLWR